MPTIVETNNLASAYKRLQKSNAQMLERLQDCTAFMSQQQSLGLYGLALVENVRDLIDEQEMQRHIEPPVLNAAVEDTWVGYAQGEPNQYCILTQDKKWITGLHVNSEWSEAQQEAFVKLIVSMPKVVDALAGLINVNKEIVRGPAEIAQFDRIIGFLKRLFESEDVDHLKLTRVIHALTELRNHKPLDADALSAIELAGKVYSEATGRNLQINEFKNISDAFICQENKTTEALSMSEIETQKNTAIEQRPKC